VVGVAGWLAGGCTRVPSHEASGGGADSSDQAAGATAPVATRAGTLETVRFALGTEPFWSVEVTPESLIYRTPEYLDGIAFARAPGSGGTVVRGARSGVPARLSLSFASDSCSDGMSDRTYPLSATVHLDTLGLRGCAEDRERWSDAGAGFRLDVPPAWGRNWYAVVRERAASAASPGQVWTDFRTRPSGAAAPALLLRIARLDRLYWDRVRRAPQLADSLVNASDPVVAERGGQVWVARIPTNSPDHPGTAAAARFEALRLDADQVRHHFSLLAAR